MTGAEIVRRDSGDSGGAVVLSVHGAFDGASAWALRIAMEEAAARDFVVDLTHAEEACEFAAGLLASWTRRWGRLKRVRFRPGSAEHARLLSGHGLELAEEPATDRVVVPGAAPEADDGIGIGFPVDLAAASSGVPA